MHVCVSACDVSIHGQLSFSLCLSCSPRGTFQLPQFVQHTVKSRFRVQNLVTKMDFYIKKYRFSVKSRLKESNSTDGGHSLNRDITVNVHIHPVPGMPRIRNTKLYILVERGNID